MPEYYLDIETNAEGSKPDIENDEILTIQYQELDSRSGETRGELKILKSWESSEKKDFGKFSLYIPAR